MNENQQMIHDFEEKILEMIKAYEEQTGLTIYGIYPTHDPDTHKVERVSTTQAAVHELPFEEE